jgi:hypothetical protein
MSTKRSLCQRKTEGGLEKGLENLWSRKKITKKAHAGRRQETKWEIPANCPGARPGSELLRPAYLGSFEQHIGENKGNSARRLKWRFH